MIYDLRCVHVSYYVVLFILQDIVKSMCVCTNLSPATMLVFSSFSSFYCYYTKKMYFIFIIYNILYIIRTQEELYANAMERIQNRKASIYIIIKRHKKALS